MEQCRWGGVKLDYGLSSHSPIVCLRWRSSSHRVGACLGRPELQTGISRTNVRKRLALRVIVGLLVLLGMVSAHPAVAADHFASALNGNSRVRLNFNADWRFTLGDVAGAQSPEFDDAKWEPVGLPHSSAFRISARHRSTLGMGGTGRRYRWLRLQPGGAFRWSLKAHFRTPKSS